MDKSTKANSACYQLVLASASPRRLELLQQLGLYAKVCPVYVDETPMVDELPRDFVLRLALEKAHVGSNAMIKQGTELPILGSDTIVDINDEILGKPANAEQAEKMLAKLSGKMHKVHTAIAVICSDNEYTDICSSEVEFSKLSTADIRAYVEMGEALGKAGAYAIQGLGGQFVKNLMGSYSGVMGLPLYETARALKACGIKTV